MMFPPITSSLSLDVYLLRFFRPESLKTLKRRRLSPEVREIRKYRQNIKIFLTTLVSEVLRERLRQAAESRRKSIPAYLQDHQWEILQATRNNQLLIDLIYPRVSESLSLSSWGPLLTILVLKAVKCLTEEETADVNILDKMCRKYITKTNCIKRKGLPQAKEDWNTVCTCAERTADTAKKAKLIKSVRNFIIDASTQSSTVKSRPYSAPALSNRNRDNAKSIQNKRPATATTLRGKTELHHSKDGPLSHTTSEQRQNKYQAPKEIMIPLAFSGRTLTDTENLSQKTTGWSKSADCLNRNSKINSVENRMEKEIWNKKQIRKLEPISRVAQEKRLRKLSGRLRTPVPIPKTIADIVPAKRPFRLMPLKSQSGIDSMKTTLDSHNKWLPNENTTIIKPNTIRPVTDFKRCNLENSQETGGVHSQISPRLHTTDHYHDTSHTDKTTDKSGVPSPRTPRQGHMKTQIKRLLKEVIKHRHVEHVASEPVFKDKNFIDTFFSYLEKTNKTVKFLHSKNIEPHSTFVKPGGGKVYFSFIHYCLYKHLDPNNSEDSETLEHLVNILLHELACDHGDSDDVIKTCWKCSQKDLAMDISVSWGNLKMCQLLSEQGIPYRHEHLVAAVKVEATDFVKQIVAHLKKTKTWNPENPNIEITLRIAHANKMKSTIAFLRSVGVQDKRAVTHLSTCLPCFI